jgi:SAM-dependent methyltransferase
MLELARRKLASAGLEARLETGDVRALRFADGEFDCVTVQGLLHHLEDLRPCLCELARVLSPGGYFYVSEPTRDPTPVKRLLLFAWSLLHRRADRPEPRVETVEEPISTCELRRALDELGLAYEVKFLTHLPPLRRRLPDAPYFLVSRVLTLPWRRRRGDLVFVFGAKSST